LGIAQAIALGPHAGDWTPEHGFHLVSDPMEWPGLLQDGIDRNQSPVPFMQLPGHCIKAAS
jgi:hypothetical protein